MSSEARLVIYHFSMAACYLGILLTFGAFL